MNTAQHNRHPHCEHEHSYVDFDGCRAFAQCTARASTVVYMAGVVAFACDEHVDSWAVESPSFVAVDIELVDSYELARLIEASEQ